MSDPTLDSIHAGIGALLREVSALGGSQGELHQKVDSVVRIARRMADDRIKDRFDIERAHRRITSLEHQMALVSEKPDVPDWRPDPREITGTHELAEIRRAAVRAAQHDEIIESRKWWREHLWLGVGALFLAAATGCGGYVAAHYAVTVISAPAAK